jgi:hypothetical protein
MRSDHLNKHMKIHANQPTQVSNKSEQFSMHNNGLEQCLEAKTEN